MRPAAWVAIAGTVLITVGAFALSFTALTDLAWRSGFDTPLLSRIWALVVDGVVVTATVAVVALRGTTSIRYAWTLLAAAATVSIAANAIHPLLPPGPVHPWIAAAVALVPPLALLSVTHLTVILGRPHKTAAPETPRVSAAATLDRERDTMQVDEPAADAADTTSDEHDDADDTPAAADDTDRAAEAARLRAQGLSLRKIGAQLGVNEKTVRRDLASLETQPAA